MSKAIETTTVDWSKVRDGVNVLKVGDHIHHRPQAGKNVTRPNVNLSTVPEYSTVLKGGRRRRTRSRSRTRSRRSRTRSRR